MPDQLSLNEQRVRELEEMRHHPHTMSLNEQRVQELNSMRSGHDIRQQIERNSIAEPKTETSEVSFFDQEDFDLETYKRLLDETKEAMYASTNDITWLTF